MNYLHTIDLHLLVYNLHLLGLKPVGEHSNNISNIPTSCFSLSNTMHTHFSGPISLILCQVKHEYKPEQTPSSHSHMSAFCVLVGSSWHYEKALESTVWNGAVVGKSLLPCDWSLPFQKKDGLSWGSCMKCWHEYPHYHLECQWNGKVVTNCYHLFMICVQLWSQANLSRYKVCYESKAGIAREGLCLRIVCMYLKRPLGSTVEMHSHFTDSYRLPCLKAMEG